MAALAARRVRPLVSFVLLAAFASIPAIPAAPAAAPPGGGVAAAAPAATEAGLGILAAGGNATDAAVATALALAVVHPGAGNLGGGGFAVVRTGGKTAALDFRETAPAAATRDMFLDGRGGLRPEASLVGPLAAGVPGSPVGYYELHRAHGRLPWRQIVAPAERLARDGFVVTERLHREIVAGRDLLRRFPETARVWLPGGAPPPVGVRMRLPKLADLLAAYAAQGPTALTTGKAARAIEVAAREHGGLLTARDLATYRPVWREPLRFAAFGWEFATMPLPSAGGIILAQTFALLERLGWPALARGSADRLHLLSEVWRRGYADRQLLGDPETTRATAADLLATGWLDVRAATIDPRRATPSTAIVTWERQRRGERAETTHLSVVDGDGDAVALTTTLNGSFGCGLLVPELELLLNNEMDDFSVAPGTPNLYGLVQGEANAVAAGRRMLSSMVPTVAWRGAAVLAVGSPGGSRIPTATGQVLLAILVDGDEPRAAVDRPRVHHQWLPDALEAEPGALSAAVRGDLQGRGHAIRERKVIGEVCVVLRQGDGTTLAAADARGPGVAAVVSTAR